MNTQAEVSGAGAIPGKPYRGIHGSSRCTVVKVGILDPEDLMPSIIFQLPGGGFRCWPEDEFLKTFAPIT